MLSSAWLSPPLYHDKGDERLFNYIIKLSLNIGYPLHQNIELVFIFYNGRLQ